MKLEMIKEFVKMKLEFEPSGHDYLHALRVLKNARLLVDSSIDGDVVYASCLVHDLIDHKLEDKYKASINEIKGLLESAGMLEQQSQMVFEIINNMSFSTGLVPASLEGKIVQDADRLDALGAIGIARTFAFGGKNGRLIYDPNTLDGNDSLSHFYQKLLLLHSKMNTVQGKTEALKRTEFMKKFIKQLNIEID